MTDEKALVSEIHTLPENLKAEVERFVKSIKNRAGAGPVKKHPRRKAGSLPGKFVLAPDFDEPLEDFKEYM